MKYISSVESVRITETIANEIKMIRIANKVAGKDLADLLNKSTAYITKFEQGGIKNLKVDDLKTICDFVSKSSDGILQLVENLSPHFDSYNNETKLSIMNMDDLLIPRPVTKGFVDFVNSSMAENNISSSELLANVNAPDEAALVRMGKRPRVIKQNKWFLAEEGSFTIFYFPCYLPEEYLKEFLSGEMDTIQRIFAEKILKSLADLISKDGNGDPWVEDALRRYDLLRIYDKPKQLDNFSEILPHLPQDTYSIFEHLNKLLTDYWVRSPETVQESISQLTESLSRSPGFMLSLMKLDYSPVIERSVREKKEFLSDVKKLIEGYEKDVDPEDDLEMYD